MTNLEKIELNMKANKILTNMMNSCAEDMIAVGIPVRVDRVIKVNIASLKGTRACCYGKMQADGEMKFVISIHNKVLKHLDNDAVMANVKNSMYHELLHTCANSQDHGAEWVKWSMLCDEKLGTHTRRHLEEKVYYNPNAKYTVYTCPDCGNEYWACKKIDDTSCEICGGNMN